MGYREPMVADEEKALAERAWAAVRAAIAKARAGKPISEVCVFCGGKLEVLGSDASWVFRCPCGKSNGALKGL